jgi:class 3 adenylate cyclase
VESVASLAACQACGRPRRDSGETCGECGASSLAPQRRVVAVVFADLTGYSALAEALDPEEVHLVIRPLMNGLRRTCTDLEGTVPAIEGDGFMAVFGALRSSEDAAQRALTAAARMQHIVSARREVSGPDLPALRVGVNLGEVLVAPSWETDGFSVSGDVVNVASRLCSLAGPGEVLAASTVLTAVPTTLRWSDESRFEVRGREFPVLARRLLWQDTSRPQGRHPSLEMPLVGRDDVLERITASGGRALLVGEAGVGKTRAAREWADRTGRLPLIGACPSFRTGDDSAALTELAARLPGDWLALAHPVVRRRVRRLRGDAVDSHEHDSLEHQIEALADVIAQRADEVVVVVDDLHWASAAELSLVHRLLAVPELPVLVTSRAEGDVDLPCAHVDVPPLDAGVCGQLVQALLPGAPAELEELLCARAGGVPLYLEQCVQLLVEEGTVAVTEAGVELLAPERLRRVPTVMRMFVTGRLDLLTGAEREVLASASVAGDVTAVDLLRHLCRRDVREEVAALVERGLLRPQDGPSGDAVRFRHALVRDVAYEGLTRSRRVEQHRAAADWYSVRLPHAALSARAAHLESALALSEGRSSPDCALAAETFMALLAQAHGMLQERPAGAREVLVRARAVVERYDSCGLDPLDLHLLLAEVLDVLGDQPGALVEARVAHARAVDVDDRVGIAHAVRLQGEALKLIDPEAAQELLKQASLAYAELGDQVGIARVETLIAFSMQGDVPARIPEAFERAYDAAQRAGDARMAATAAQMVAAHSLLIGRAHLETWTGHAEALARSEDEGARCRLLLGRAAVELAALEPESALSLARRAEEIARQVGIDHVVSNALWVACDAATVLGRLAEAVELLERTLQHAATRHTPHQRFDALVAQAVLNGRAGGSPEAREATIREVRELADELGAAYVREALWCEAQCSADSGHWAAVPSLTSAVVLADSTGGQPFLSLRPRLLRVQSQVMARERVPFSECDALRRDSREGGAPAVDAISQRWLEIDDLLKGEWPRAAIQLPPLPDLAEARAVDHLLHGLLAGDDDRLVDAAAEWRSLGVHAWAAVPLVWHAHLTGEDTHLAEAREVLAACGAPDDAETVLRERLRSFVPRRTLGE